MIEILSGVAAILAGKEIVKTRWQMGSSLYLKAKAIPLAASMREAWVVGLI
jgi:hypothetical protein